MSEIKVLYLPIKKKWFDLIREGTKKEEYRLYKEHWCKRLLEKGKPKEYDWICLRNGYGANAPEYWLPWQGFRVGTDLNPEWCDFVDGKIYFKITVAKGQDGIPF